MGISIFLTLLMLHITTMALTLSSRLAFLEHLHPILCPTILYASTMEDPTHKIHP